MSIIPALVAITASRMTTKGTNMAKRKSDDEIVAELKEALPDEAAAQQQPARDFASLSDAEKQQVLPGYDPRTKCIASFRDGDHGLEYHAAQALIHLQALGCKPYIARGNVVTEDFKEIARLCVTVPE